VSVDIQINRLDEWLAAAGSGALFEAAAIAALATADRPLDGELSITFVSEIEIRDLNRRYLGVAHATDVIAFDLAVENELLGDIYVSPALAQGASGESGTPEVEELMRLVVHGVLHLLGHEHEEGEERYASPMFRLQERIVERLTGDRS
jgi:probable rRNA maturation factor